MDSMEVKIESIINSSQTTKIILGSKEENSGLTIVLKPKPKISIEISNSVG
jgi:hypothetical protein